MSKRYRPSNGAEGADFMARFCNKCKRDQKYRETSDGADACPIATNAMAYGYNDPNYPQEWIEDDDGRNPRCTAYAPMTHPRAEGR